MIARYCEFADYNSSNSRILQLEFLNLLRDLNEEQRPMVCGLTGYLEYIDGMSFQAPCA